MDASDPRWAKDVVPVEDEFDWQGRLALSADGQKIVMRDRQRGQTNPLIEQDAAAQPEFAYAESPRQRTGEPSGSQTAEELVDARTRSAVNMRAAGEKNATVITVVPSGAAVRVEQDCQHWCASVYEDKQGYIYKTYLTVVDMGSTASVTPQAAPAETDQVSQTARNEMRPEDYAPSRLR